MGERERCLALRQLYNFKKARAVWGESRFAWKVENHVELQ